MDYIFPAVIYKDEEQDDYVGTFDDIKIYFQGRTVEEAFYTACKYLRDYCKLSYKMYGEVVEKPRDYFESLANHKDGIVVLVHAEVKANKANKDNDIII